MNSGDGVVERSERALERAQRIARAKREAASRDSVSAKRKRVLENRRRALERRARLAATVILDATRGVCPKESFKTYLSDRAFQRLVARASVHRRHLPSPDYQLKCFLSIVSADAVEASVVAVAPNMTRAVALRLEREHRAWKVVEFSTV
ncbi:MAG: Rv3235 family protein [Bifidobacteriaceae bacterium]|nr:Rv3235 family protein [Bifidobacteriaceae bacterium]